MTLIIGDIPFMHDALASIGVQGYTQVLFGAELKPSQPARSPFFDGKMRV